MEIDLKWVKIGEKWLKEAKCLSVCLFVCEFRVYWDADASKNIGLERILL